VGNETNQTTLVESRRNNAITSTVESLGDCQIPTTRPASSSRLHAAAWVGITHRAREQIKSFTQERRAEFMLRVRLAGCLFAAAVIFWQSPVESADDKTSPKIPWRIEDLYLSDYFEPAVVSPDEHRSACVRHWVDQKSRKNRQSLWLVEARIDKPRPLEVGEPDARSPVFSPDSRWIAFQSTRPLPRGYKPLPTVPPASDPVTDIWLISADGGEAIPLGPPDKQYGRVLDDPFYGRVAFSPDGRKLVFVADDGGSDRTKEELAANVEIVRPDQGEGYTGYRPAQIWVAELDPKPHQHAASRIVRLTDDDVWYGEPQWMPDGGSIIVHANKTKDRESVRWSINKNYDLWQVNVADRTQRRLTRAPGPEVFPRVSSDGSRLACLSSPRKGGHIDVFNLSVVTLGRQPDMQVVIDSDQLKLGQWEPAIHLPERIWDGPHHVIYDGVRGIKSELKRLNVFSGGAIPLMSSKYPGPDTEMQRLHRLRAKMTPPGSSLSEHRLAGENRVITWDNDEGQPVEGALTLPPPSVASPPYKLLLFPHGGPHGRDTEFPSFFAQVFAANGYAVLRPNFRGSTGYGRKFLDAARRDLGGPDMRDVLTGIDYLVRQQLVDPQRQFVYGVSYGGFMTCWLVGHTNQFRAAAAQNAVTEMNVMWGTSDLQSWTEWELGGKPWEVPETTRKASPFTYVANVRTPTLVLHAREDRRCPVAMGRMFYQALRSRGVETQMVIYPDEGHLILDPRHQEDILRRTLAWFKMHDLETTGHSSGATKKALMH